MSYTSITKVKGVLGITDTDWDTSLGYHILYVDSMIDNRAAEHGLSASENNFFEALATDWVAGRWLTHEGEASHEDSLDRGKALITMAQEEMDVWIRDQIRSGVPAPNTKRRRVYVG